MAEPKPGVLPDRDLQALFEAGAIRSSEALDADQIQPASLDLRLAQDAYRIRASFLPGPDQRVIDAMQWTGLEMHRIELHPNGTVLEAGCVYIVPLMESLTLPAGIYGRANPKSSTGRIDVFTRVVTNKGKVFDEVPPGYSGPLWLEISPRTFSILVRPGDRLAQLRLRRGKQGKTHEKTVSIDLEAPPGKPVGWRAKRHAGLIDLRGISKHTIRILGAPVAGAWPARPQPRRFLHSSLERSGKSDQHQGGRNGSHSP